ncbi:MAG: anthranilate synthase component II [Enterococcus sp.]
MILLIDNYDSFTYNLVHQFHQTELVVLRNDDPTLEEVAKKADGIVLSPGPGYPAQAGEMEAIIREFYQEKPILGICLGHQAIGEVFGGSVIPALEIMHGKQSEVQFKAKGLFENAQAPFQVMRYHSLVVNPENLPQDLEVVAEYEGIIMALQHKKYPIYGLQFHPESIGTGKGQVLIDAFIQKVEEQYAKNI